MRLLSNAFVAVLLVAVGLAGPSASAATVQWINTAGGNWSVGANWSSGSVPTSADDVVITADGTYTVTLNVAATVNTLTLGAASGTQTLAISSTTLALNGASSIAANGTLALSGGTLTLAAPLTNAGTFNWSGGTINGAGGLTNNAAFNLTGAGTRYWYQSTLTNNGTVTSGGGYLYLYTSPVISNTGTWSMQADGGYYVGSGVPVFNNSGTLEKSAGTGVKDFYLQLNNSGQVKVLSGTLRLAAGGTSSAPFSVASGATLNFYNGTHTLDAGATVTGLGTVSVTSATVTAADTWDVGTATSVFGGALTLNGNVVSLGTVTANGGTFNLNTNSTVTALGNVTIGGGTLNLNSTASFTMSGLTLSAGTLGGTSALTITGTFAWSGGAVNRTGAVTLPAGSIFNITTASTKYWYSATLHHSGTATDSGAYLYVYNSAVLNNLAGATWDIQSDGGYYTGSGTPRFNNSGTLRKSTATGNKDFYLTLDNTGQVDVLAGTLRLASGGTSSGPFTVSGGATLTFYNGTHTLNAGASVTGAGAVQVYSAAVTVADTWDVGTATSVNGGGSLTLTGNVVSLGTVTAASGTFNLNTNSTVTALGAVTISGGALNLNSTASFTMTGLTLSAGTFGGTSAVTISGTFAWSGGAINRTGAVTLPAGSAFDISGSSTKYLQNTTIHHSGTATSTTTGYVYLYTTTFNNLAGATYDMKTDAGYYTGSGTSTFNNSGTLRKSAGTGIKDFYFVLNNDGQTDVQSGTLRLAGGGAGSGAFDVAAGAVLAFQNGTHTLGAAASVAGAGAVQVTSGTVTVAGTWNVTGGTTLHGGTLTLSGTVTATGALTINNGTLNLDAAAAYSVASLSLANGLLGGTTPLTITSSFQWSGGSVNRTGSITLPNTCTTTIGGSSTKYLDSVTIDNSGVVTSNGTGYVYLYDGAVINNLSGATYDIQSDAGYHYAGGAASQFNNGGTLKKSAGAAAKEFYFVLNNSNQVLVQAGTLRLHNGGSSSGAFTVAPGATLQYSAGTHTLGGTSSLTGGGAVKVTGGTVNAAGTYDITGGTTVAGGTLSLTGTLNATGAVSIANGTFDLSVPAAVSLATLTLSGGTFAGSSPVSVTTFGWSGGTVNRAGAVDIPAGGTLNITANTTKYWQQATLNNAGTVQSGSAGYIYVYNGAVLKNLAGGQWNMTTDAGYYHGGGAMPQILNAGTMTKSSAGTKDVAIGFSNNGLLDIGAGTFRLYNGSGTNSGTYAVAAGATLRFDGGTQTLDASSTLTGAGTVEVNNGTVHFSGTYAVTGTATVSGGGTFNVEVPAAIPTLHVSGGTLGGSGALTVTSFTWSGGSVNRAGAVNIPATTGTLNITGGNAKYWQQATLNNSGTVTSSSTYYLYFYNGAVINNLSGGSWLMTSDLGYYHGGGAMPQFNNAGTMTKSGSGTKDVGIAFHNTGQLNVDNGVLRPFQGGTSSGAVTVASGATLRFDGQTYTIAGTGTLGGAGTYQVAGGTLAISTDNPLAVARLTLAGGILGGTAPITVTTFDWTSGTVNRSGAVNIPATTGTLNLTTGGGKYWQEATLNNSGTVHSGSSYYLYFYNGAVVNNLAGGSWNMTSDLGYYHGGGAMPQFNNTGTVTKSAGTGVKELNFPFHNTGQLSVDSGTVRLTGGGTSSGSYTAAAGAAVQFGGGTHALSSTSTLGGAGTVEITAGTVTFAGTYSAPATISVSNSGVFDINSGSAVSLPALNLSGGTLGGTANLTVTTFNWTGGTVHRTGSVDIPATTGTLAITTGGGKYWRQATLNNAGTVTSSSTYYLYFYDGAVVNNLPGGAWNITTDLGYYHGGGAMPQFNNAGTVTKSGTGSKDIAIPLNNDGQLNVMAGTLRLTGGGTSSGSCSVAAGAKVQFGGGTHNLGSTSTLAGAGIVEINGATVNFSGTYSATGSMSLANGAMNIDSAGTVPLPAVTVSGGTLGGSSPLNVNAFTWSGGVINRTGAINISSGSSLSFTGGNARYLYQAAINNSGAITSSMTGYVYLYNGAAVNNLAGGTFDLQSDGGFYHGGGALPQFNNGGTLIKSGGSAAAQPFHCVFANSGTVDLRAGILNFAAGYTQTSTGLLKVSIGGTTAGTQYARGSVSGTATLGGALNVVLTNAFTPTVGDLFQIMSFSSRSGDFATKSGLTYAGGSMSYAATNSAVTLTGATATADLRLTKTASGSTVATGATFTYTLSAENLGPSAANDVSVTDTLPSGLSLNSASGTGWSCSSDGGTPATVTCTTASLAVGVAAPIALSVTAPSSPQSLVNTASITTSVGDPTASNDTSTTTVSVVSPTPGITVTSAADSGPGTLRQAILDANNGICSAPCTIGFNLAPVQPIVLASALPPLTASMILDGTTQPGYATTPLIDITTDGVCTCPIGLEVNGTGSTLRALKIRQFSDVGVRLAGGGGHTLELSIVGDQTTRNASGVRIESSGNLVQNNTVAFSGAAAAAAVPGPIQTNTFPSSGYGIGVFGAVTGGRILGNAIHSNDALAIDLGLDGATAGDAGDADTGANNLQNAPTIASAQISGGTLTATVSVDSSAVAATGSIRVELFEADAGGQAAAYLGGACFAGNVLAAQTVAVPAGGVTSGESIVATATSYSGTGCVTVSDGTSELSAPFTTCTPPSAAIAAPQSVCAGTPGHTASVPFVNGATYAWTITNGTITSGTSGSSVTFTAGAAGTTDLQVTVTSNGCTSTGSTTIPINTAAAATIAADGPTTFCSGGSVTLTASDGASYLWSNGQITPSIVVTASGNYSVTVTDANGCSSASAPVTVTVNPTPVVNIAGPTATCAGGAGVTLDAGPSFATYLWSTGEATQTITVSPNSTTTYSVTVTNGAGCSATDTHEVFVNTAPAPAVTASGPTTFCDGGSVTLSTGAAGTYQWYRNDAPLADANSASLQVTQSGSYKVEVTSGSCSGVSAPVTVTVNTPATPTISASGPTAFCTGGSVTLTASAGSSYQWHLDNTPINGANDATHVATAAGSYTVTVIDANGCSAASAPVAVTVDAAPAVAIDGPASTCPNTQITLDGGANFAQYLWSTGQQTRYITVAPAADTTYSVTVTDANGCTASDSHAVTISANPVAGITAPAAVCAGSTGNTASVPVQPGATYTWSISNGTITAGLGTHAVTFTAGASGSVTLDVTVVSGGCSSSDSAVVTVNTPPSTTIAGPATMCAGASVTLDAGAGFASYSWSSGQTSRFITVSPAETTTYSVIVTDPANCSGTASHTVTVYPAASVAISGPAASCGTGSITLDAGPGFTVYAWSTGATTRQITVSPANTTTYSVDVTDANGCTASDTHTVTVTATPTTAITAPASVCESSAGHTASVPPQPGATYAWSITNGTIAGATDTNAVTFTAGASGQVTLNVTVTNGSCVAPGSVQVPIVPDPSVTISGPATVCPNSNFTLSVPATFATYLWSNGATTPSITVNQAAATQTYSVTVTNASGCSATDTHTVTLSAQPDATITAPASAPSSSSQSASVPAQAGATYLWSIANGSITGGQGTNAITFQTGSAGTTDVAVQVTVAGCVASDLAVVTIADAPPPPCETTPPSLLAPANGATVASPVLLQWTPVSGAVSYDVFVNGTLRGTVPTTSLTVSLPAGAASWYVVANLGGNCAPLTASAGTFTVPESNGCAQNGRAQLIAPAPGATATSPVTFSWTHVPNAIGYRVAIQVNGAAAEEIGATSGATTLTANVPPGAIVAFVDTLFNGCAPTRSDPVAFSVPAPDPCAARATAIPIAPAGGAVVNSSSVLFRWTAASGASGYRVWASVDGGAPLVLGTTSETSLRETISRGTVVWWVESLYEGCASTESQRFPFTIPAAQNCGTVRPDPIAPANGSTVTGGEVTFAWSSVAGATGYELYLSLAGGTASLIGTTGGATSLTRSVPAGELQWFVRALVDRCPSRDSQTAGFVYQQPPSCAASARPILVEPVDGARSTSPVSFDWSDVAGATGYQLYAVRGENPPQLVASTTASHTGGVNLGTGRTRWFIRALFGAGCPSLDSAERELEIVPVPAACTPLPAPVISAPAQVSAGMPLRIQWSPVAGATAYQLQLAGNSAFTGAETVDTNATQHPLTAVQTLYARVRAIDARCTTTNVSPFGPSAAVFILPPAAPEGSTTLSDPAPVTFTFVLGFEYAGQTFTAVSRQPWLSVSPASGVVAPGGTTLTVVADTRGLPAGTSLGGITVTLSAPAAGGVAANNSTVISPSFSVGLVSPVTPSPKDTPPPDALIIPAVAHADGINSHFQSDVRVSNTSAKLITYQLTFTPSGADGLAQGQQTQFSVEPGRTVALDDILKTWFGTGGGSAMGTLEIRPLTETAAASDVFGMLRNLTTFASSRTFNVTANGTFGQYIPAVPFAKFVGRDRILSLQQIAQSSKYRTNLGIVEGSGHRASLIVRVFGANGQYLTDFPVDLRGGQHLQLNAFLRAQGINTLEDGRVEIEVASGDGLVTAYASVLDSATSDPLLVTPVALDGAGQTRWVVPGVADLASGFADWQTDMRLFNAGQTPVEATFTFHSQSGAEPKVRTLTIPPGQVRQFDKALTALFETNNDAGAVHITTTDPARLIATARTYNQTGSGTYGQFISAVTVEEAAALGSRPLQLLQIEESDRFRSNIGLVEVTGKPVRVEISAVPPDAWFTAVTELELRPNEFRQLNALLRSMGLGDTHNARVTVRVLEGEGRVTAYASVIDMKTNDPTYIPAQ